MPTSWWYLLDGAQYGPISPDALQALIQQKTLVADTLVWHADLPNWQRIAATPVLTGWLPAYQSAPLPASTDSWWYAVGGLSQGPIDEPALRTLFEQGQLDAASL